MASREPGRRDSHEDQPRFGTPKRGGRGSLLGDSVEALQILRKGRAEFNAQRPGARLRPQGRGTTVVGCDYRCATAEPSNLDREVPGERRPNDIAVANGNADNLRRERTSRRDGSFWGMPTLGVSGPSQFGPEVVKHVGEVVRQSKILADVEDRVGLAHGTG